MSRPAARSPVMTAPEVDAYLAEVFPQIASGGKAYTVDAIGPMGATLRLDAGERHLRPGGTVSGPTMMELADLALYVAVLGMIGPVALAVTTNLSINVLRKPSPGPMRAECRLLKLGKRLAVGEVSILSGPDEDLVAHVVGTYSIPDR